jgi:hypothetical protein
MNVGSPLPPVQEQPGVARKGHLQDESNRIMDAVWALIPVEDRAIERAIANEHFELSVEVQDEDRKPVSVPPELEIQHGAAFSKFTHRKTLINNFIQNMNLPEVAPLTRLVDRPALEDIITAAAAILDHLEHENPFYFTYRYGQSEGRAMGAGVLELYRLALWARERHLSLSITPIRRFKDIASGQEVTLTRPEDFAKW